MISQMIGLIIVFIAVDLFFIWFPIISGHFKMMDNCAISCGFVFFKLICAGARTGGFCLFGLLRSVFKRRAVVFVSF